VGRRAERCRDVPGQLGPGAAGAEHRSTTWSERASSQELRDARGCRGEQPGGADDAAQVVPEPAPERRWESGDVGELEQL
jgi:hypothetical protein